MVPYTMEVPKEMKELVDGVESVLSHFLDGKSLSEAAALLPAVLAAVDGINKLGEEVKGQQMDEGAAYLVHRILHVLRKPKVVQAVG